MRKFPMVDLIFLMDFSDPSGGQILVVKFWSSKFLLEAQRAINISKKLEAEIN